tara:strand:+ start:109 stop:717 length:609 start_codon:yes stop_codon:yes gene_type:complete
MVTDPFIWKKHNSFSDELCDNLIIKFESDPGNQKYRGLTGDGIQPEIKETWDLLIEGNLWKEEDTIIFQILSDSVNEYIDYLQKYDSRIDMMNGIESMVDGGYHIQKYEPNKGFYTWHNDYRFDEKLGSRVLTFMWYLNTVDVGGETEFADGTKIKPEKGKLLMFPSTWTYTHRGCMPYSNHKYICTGWIYNGWYKNYDVKN